MANKKLEEFLARKAQLQKGGSDTAVARQRALGKMTARERLQALFDADSFVEMDLFVEHRGVHFGMAGKPAPADGVVTGYGTVDGRLVYACAQDFTVMGGSLGEMHAGKIVKMQESALKVGAPVVCINDSGGARIQEGVDSLAGYGRVFYNNTQASGVIPQISVIMGPCAGGAVYSPALMDFVFMVKDIGQMFITGPQVIQAVTGEVVSAEKLGGAATHNSVSGVAHFMDEDELSCIRRIKELLSYLPSNNMENPPVVQTGDSLNRTDPTLNEVIPESTNRPYDMRLVIHSLADNGVFFESQALYAGNMLTGFIRMGGRTVGVIASQPKVLAGCLDINASDKASRFIRTCDAFNIPLLTLEDVPGFLPGTQQEYGGIIRHGAKMLFAYSEATVPKITVITRKSYGGAYIGMCSKHLGADMVLAWPTAEIAVMGPEGAANIIFSKEIESAPNQDAKRQEKIAEYRDAMMNPYIAASRGYVDDIIEPALTRKYIITALDALQGKRVQRQPKKHGNIPL